MKMTNITQRTARQSNGYALFAIMQRLDRKPGTSKIIRLLSGEKYAYPMPTGIEVISMILRRMLRDKPLDAEKFIHAVNEVAANSRTSHAAFRNFMYANFGSDDGHTLVGEVSLVNGEFNAYVNFELATIIKAEAKKRKYKLMSNEYRDFYLTLFELTMELKLDAIGVKTKRIHKGNS